MIFSLAYSSSLVLTLIKVTSAEQVRKYIMLYVFMPRGGCEWQKIDLIKKISSKMFMMQIKSIRMMNTEINHQSKIQEGRHLKDNLQKKI